MIIIKAKEYIEDNRTEFVKIIISLTLFCIGLLIKQNISKLLIMIVAYLIVGFDVIFKAFNNIKKGKVFDENFLMTIATIGAFCIGEYSEAVAVMLFYSIGEVLEDIAVGKSKNNITKLMDIRSDYANLIVDNDVKRVDPKEVKIDDIIVVKAGEKVPLDGVIIEGYSYVDTSCITGESVPRKIGVNDNIISGFINREGVLKVRVTGDYKNSTASRILEMVENSSNRKTNTERFITKFSKVYTPIVVIIALLIAIIPPLVSDISFSDSIYKALVCLVISCPCALVISIPLSYFAGIGCASKNGILVKGSNYIEKLSNLGCIVFDKTGTLTEGVFEVVKVRSYNKYTNDDVIKYLAYAESYSNHPISYSIGSKYGKDIDSNLISNYQEIPGKGISVEIEENKILAGNIKILLDNNIEFVESNDNGTVVYLVINNIFAGYVVISDVLKDDSKKIVNVLKDMKIDSAMLTGDNNLYASEICSRVGIDRYYSDLLPEGKVDKLKEIISDYNNKNVAFIGDGINDALVLSESDIGIAMGDIGSDAAVEAADVVIMTDELFKIVDSIKISKKVKKIVIENIWIILFVKLFAMALGIMGIAMIWQAVIADVGVAVVTILNSLRCLKYKS